VVRVRSAACHGASGLATQWTLHGFLADGLAKPLDRAWGRRHFSFVRGARAWIYGAVSGGQANIGHGRMQRPFTVARASTVAF